MKQFEEIVGIDVSKLTLDVKMHLKGVKCQVENTKKGYEALLKWVSKNSSQPAEKLLYCFEHTGLYSLPLATFLSERSYSFAMVPALEIKRSLGITRGKSDIIDAARIAEYAYLRRHQIKLTVLPSKNILKLKDLLALRGRMVSQRAGYKASLKEIETFFVRKDNEELFDGQKNLIKAFNQNIKVLDQKMRTLLEEEPSVHEKYKLITSIKGIGPVVGAYLIVVTNCFTAFQNSRQLACYSGIAPFQKQSGTSLKAQSKISHLANKKVKALLDRAASSAIQADPELKLFYQKRVQLGKSKRSTINIVRNKLLHRVFAVVKRGTPFVETHRYAA
jgi:transposase